MLHEAKARFSELVRLANTAGPQRVTVHGRNGIVVLSEEDYEKLKTTQPGTLLVDLMRNSPLRDVEFASPRVRSRVRDVDL
jgi:prevent-host-death family protein